MKKEKKNVSKIKSRGQITGIVAIVIALVMAIVLYMSTTVKANNTIEIISVKSDIAQGKQITNEDIQLIDVSSYNLPGNVIKEKDDVIGKYANIPMKAGDYLLSSKVSKSALGTDTQIANLSDGNVAISFTVKSQASGVANKLQANDIIRIYSYADGNVQEHKELSFVQVLSVSDSNGSEVNSSGGTEDIVYSTITVRATPTQAMKIVLLENTSTIYTSFLTRNAETSHQLLQKQAEMLGG